MQEAMERGPTDENAYPGSSKFRRRSSIRSLAFSDGGGEESMDMDSDDTAFGPAAYLQAQNEEAILDGDFPDDDFQFDDDDMEVTEAIQMNIQKRRSLALVPSRQPLASVISPQENHDEESLPRISADESYNEDDSHQYQSSVSESNVSQPMEFTVPLIRPPAPPSEAWLALRSATHSGDTPYIPSSDDDEDHGERDMEITDALTRLQAARRSLGLGDATGDEELEQHDNSFTSSEDSFGDDDVAENDGNQTVNVTQLMRRVSLGAGTGDGNSTMEITSIYDSQEEPRDDRPDTTGTVLSSPSENSVAEVNGNVTQAKLQESVDEVSEARPKVFKPAVQPEEAPHAFSSTPAQRLVTVPKPFSFSFTPRGQPPASPVRHRPPSPVKFASPSKTKFSAAFAPPVARPSPKKRSNNVIDGIESEDRPSPAKKLAGPGKLTALVHELPKVQPAKLSPSKRMPSQVQAEPASGSIKKRSSIGLRRPSGYFAQRKSMGAAAPDASPVPASLAKKADTNMKIIPSTGDDDPGLSIEKEPIAPESQSVEITQPVPVGLHDSPTRGSPIHGITGNLPMRSPAPKSLAVPSQHESPPRDLLRPPTLIHASPRSSNPVSEREPEELPIPDYEDVEVASNPTHSASTLDEVPNPTEQWREDIAEEGFAPEDGPQISIAQFFEMTGIRFMDEIAAPRRSTVHSSTLRPSRRQSMESEIPLSEYVVAMAVDVPQLELYTHVSKDLQVWIERIKGIYKEAEDEALKMTPELFQEFVLADEEGQNELLHQLKLIKVHKHAQAKSEWYDWKMQWVEQLYQKADQGFRDLEAVRLISLIVSSHINIYAVGCQSSGRYHPPSPGSRACSQ